jgi:lysozyme family protein
MTFEQALQGLRYLEGGFTIDDGGPTEAGITQSTYDSFCAAQGIPSTPVSELTPQLIADFYRLAYWDPLLCGQLPDKVDFVLFQWAVNHEGPGRAGGSVESLQICSGVAPDGIMGPETVKAANSVDPDKLCVCILNRQDGWYEADSLKNPDAPLRGWRARVDRARAFIGSSLPSSSNNPQGV